MWLFRSGLFVLGFAGINIYTGLKVFALIKYFLPQFRAFFFWPLYVLFCFSFVWMMQVRIEWLRQMAMNTLPALFYFFLGLLVLDALRFVLQHLHFIPSSAFYSFAGTGIALILTIGVLVYGYHHARNIHTVYYTITLNKGEGMPPLRFALVSDLHIGATVDRKWVAKIVDVVNKAEPDLICLAGDIFDRNIDTIPDLEGVALELRRFNAPMGVYACQGNHDVDRLSLREEGKTDRIQDFLKTAGIRFLLDEVELVADRFYLAGRRDSRPIGSRQERKTAAELTAGLELSKPLVFLDHQPVDFIKEEEAGADLILSGHTHRGQVFPGNVVTRGIYKKAGAVHYGYWQGRSAQALVSSGAGVWGPPIRVATQSEVVVVEVLFGK